MHKLCVLRHHYVVLCRLHCESPISPWNSSISLTVRRQLLSIDIFFFKGCSVNCKQNHTCEQISEIEWATHRWNTSSKFSRTDRNDVTKGKWRHKMLTSPGLRIDLFSFLGADLEIALRNKTRFLGTRWSQKSWKGGKSQVICLFCRE